MLWAHAAVVHAILVDGLETGIEELLGDVFHPVDDFPGDSVVLVAGFEAHDTDELGAECFHPRDSPLDLLQRDLKGCGDCFGPIHDSGAETEDLDLGIVELLDGAFEGWFGQIVQVGLGVAGDLNISGLDVFPAEFPGGGDLGG
jgi:hypothetical protein